MAIAELKHYYDTHIRQTMTQKFGYTCLLEVPRISKIIVSMGVGKAVEDKKILEKAFADLEKIAGQKPVMTYARKSISTFKVREGWPIGCKVTLRRDRMFHFMKKLTDVVIPRVRDFRGLPKSFDGRGNYSLGFREQIVFPEINYEEIDTLRGLNVTVVTSAKTDEESFFLLKAFGFPFKQD